MPITDTRGVAGIYSQDWPGIMVELVEKRSFFVRYELYNAHSDQNSAKSSARYGGACREENFRWEEEETTLHEIKIWFVLRIDAATADLKQDTDDYISNATEW